MTMKAFKAQFDNTSLDGESDKEYSVLEDTYLNQDAFHELSKVTQQRLM